VTVAFANNPAGATPGGKLSATASHGVATFSGLTINKAGPGCTVRLFASGLSPAVSSTINVTRSGGGGPIVAQGAIDVPDSSLAPLVLDSRDLFVTAGIKKRRS
jgi:hypothetical protein